MATTKKSADLKATPKTATTAVAVRPKLNVVSIQEQLKAQAAAMAGRTAPPTGSKIKLARGKFTLPDGQTSAGPIDAVIVDFITTHNFYEGKFDPNNIQPPSCFAIGLNPKDMTPSKNSPKPQSSNCQSCPMNQFGSDGNGKACKNGRRLALLPVDQSGADVDHEADLWTMDVSPTALKGFDGYVQSLQRTFGEGGAPVAFITEIGLNPDVDYVQLKFGNPRPIASIGEALGRQAEAGDLLKTEPDVTPRNTATSKPAARRPVAARR